MALISASFSSSVINFPPNLCTRGNRLPISKNQFSRTSVSMDSGDELKAKFMEFPHVSVPTRNLMVELLSTLEIHLQPECTLPPDVQHFGNPAATASASLHLRSGLPSSQIDFILGGWIHCQLPSGGALNIVSLSAYLKPTTDAPHFLLELIQSSPTSAVLILDLTPRKDLILYSDYLKTYYEGSQLDRHREHLQTLSEVRPYVSRSLYVRALLSPTAIPVSIESTNMEEVIQEHVAPVAKELLRFWVQSCACSEGGVAASDRDYLAERDRIIKTTTIEVDLGSSFPRMFGQEVADRVLQVLRQIYTK